MDNVARVLIETFKNELNQNEKERTKGNTTHENNYSYSSEKTSFIISVSKSIFVLNANRNSYGRNRTFLALRLRPFAKPHVKRVSFTLLPSVVDSQSRHENRFGNIWTVATAIKVFPRGNRSSTSRKLALISLTVEILSEEILSEEIPLRISQESLFFQ